MGTQMGFFKSVADVVPFGLIGIIAENGEETKPHALNEGDTRHTLEASPYGGFYLFLHDLGPGLLSCRFRFLVPVENPRNIKQCSVTVRTPLEL